MKPLLCWQVLTGASGITSSLSGMRSVSTDRCTDNVSRSEPDHRGYPKSAHRSRAELQSLLHETDWRTPRRTVGESVFADRSARALRTRTARQMHRNGTRLRIAFRCGIPEPYPPEF